MSFVSKILATDVIDDKFQAEIPVQITAPQATITCEAASAALTAAVRHAGSLGIPVAVAVVDRAGLLVGFLRMPGAPLHCADIATDKAYTAASFGLPTHQWTEVLAQHSEAVRHGLPRRPRFVVFGGGLPIDVAGTRIGGIGVSGASEEQDQQCARAGLDALGVGE